MEAPDQQDNLPALPYTPCTANSKQAKRRCRRRPIPGGTVCTSHGGKAAQVQQAAQRTLAARAITAQANASLAHEGVEPVENPLEELSKLASGAMALQQALGARVNALADVEHMDLKDTPQVRVVMDLYAQAMDRTGKFLDMLVRHGYAERKVQLAENEAMLVAGVIRRVVAGLGLTPDQQKLAQKLLADEFRALERAGE